MRGAITFAIIVELKSSINMFISVTCIFEDRSPPQAALFGETRKLDTPPPKQNKAMREIEGIVPSSNI